MGDKIERNKNIAVLAQAYLQLKPEERTAEKAMMIFSAFNTNTAGNSKERLDSVDDIDKYFKDINGLNITPMNDVTKDEFLENIDDWAEYFAAYEAPEPEEKVEMPFKKVDTKTAKDLADNLIKALAAETPGGVSMTGGIAAWLGDLFTVDTERHDEASMLFGPDEGQINSSNIVEVLKRSRLTSLERVIGYLDDEDALNIRTFISDALTKRADILHQKGFLSKKDVDDIASQALILQGAEKDNEFRQAIYAILPKLTGVGVE